MHVFLKGLLAAMCALAVSIVAAGAESGAWRVLETSGAVRTTQAMAGVQMVSTGETLGAGAVVSTGMDGRAVLSNGAQQIIVGPNSRMSLPAVEEKGMTRIIQDLGTLLFKVDKQEKQHFRVETPIIAAVVKGTTFTVTAGASGHSVHVAEGAVEVSALNGGAAQMVTAGMTARVTNNNPGVIEMSSGARGGDEQGESERGGRNFERKAESKKAHNLIVPTEIGAGALDFANLSDGLVQPSENASTIARANAGLSNDAASAVLNQGGAAAVQQVRMAAIGDSGIPDRSVGNALGVETAANVNGAAAANAGGGAGNAAVNAGVGNAANGNAGATATAGAGNAANGNGGATDAGAGVTASVSNDNGGVNVDVGVAANGNGGVTDAGAGVASVNVGNDNGGVNVGVNVGDIGVAVSAGDGGVTVGTGIGGLGVKLGKN